MLSYELFYGARLNSYPYQIRLFSHNGIGVETDFLNAT